VNVALAPWGGPAAHVASERKLTVHRFDIASLPSTPWKNGGGSTREVVCRPTNAGMDAFDWRVSIATIAQAGPFSAFPGVDRVIMLLEGDGVHLRSSGGIDHRLDQAYAPFAFPGDVALDCTLLGGTSTDFNVMTRRGALRADVQLLHAATDIPVAQRGLLLALQGNWQVHGENTEQTCAAGQGLWWDAAPQGWQLTPQDDDAVLVWVRLDTIGA
jgi:environmental stress-induced protein Ves